MVFEFQLRSWFRHVDHTHRMLLAIPHMILQVGLGVVPGQTAEAEMPGTFVVGFVSTQTTKVLYPHPVSLLPILQEHEVDGNLRVLGEA